MSTLLTYELRQYIRRVRSELVRETVPPPKDQKQCRRCDCDLEEFTIGCSACYGRHASWVRRGKHSDPEWFKQQAKEHKAYQLWHKQMRKGD